MLKRHGVDASLYLAVVDPTIHLLKGLPNAKRAEYIEKMELQLNKLNKKMLGLEDSPSAHKTV